MKISEALNIIREVVREAIETDNTMTVLSVIDGKRNLDNDQIRQLFDDMPGTFYILRHEEGEQSDKRKVSKQEAYKYVDYYNARLKGDSEKEEKLGAELKVLGFESELLFRIGEFNTDPSVFSKNENYADGKVKGKSRPGRVKKFETASRIIQEIIKETIRKVNGKYVVYPEKGGKRLGTHNTLKQAQDQLTAIHLNKEQSEEGTVDISLRDINGKKVVLATMDGEKLGALRLKPYLQSYQVDSVIVKPEYRGFGIGKEMYRLAHEKLGPLYSDAKQTPDAENLWKSLLKKGEARKQGDRFVMTESKHEPMNPGILKRRLGKLSCTKVRKERQELKDKGTTYAKALQRYLNYHCQ